jgi:hypothetical protein
MFQGHTCNIAGSRGISAISGFVRGIFAKTLIKNHIDVSKITDFDLNNN